jgi:hypothetical protein
VSKSYSIAIILPWKDIASSAPCAYCSVIGCAVQLAARDRAQVLERAVRGEGREPRHVEGREVGHLTGAEAGLELLVHRVPVERLIVDRDPRVLRLEAREAGFSGVVSP